MNFTKDNVLVVRVQTNEDIDFILPSLKARDLHADPVATSQEARDLDGDPVVTSQEDYILDLCAGGS